MFVHCTRNFENLWFKYQTGICSSHFQLELPTGGFIGTKLEGFDALRGKLTVSIVNVSSQYLHEIHAHRK